MAENGDFVVAWTTEGRDGLGDGVAAQRFSSAGVSLGDEILIPEHTDSNETVAFLEVAENGNFLLTWKRNSPIQSGPAAGDGHFGRYFNTEGPEGGIFYIPSTSVSSDGQGHHVALSHADAGSGDLFARLLPADSRQGKFRFANLAPSIAENNVTPFMSEIYRIDGALGDSSVEPMTLRGDAKPWSDYVESSSELLFPEEDSWQPQTFPVPLRTDIVVEDDESFFVQLFNPTGGVPIAGDVQEVTILNEDFTPSGLFPRTLGFHPRVDFPSGDYSLENVAISPLGSTAVLGKRFENDVFLGFYVTLYDRTENILATSRVDDASTSVESSAALAFNNDGDLLVAWLSNGSVFGHWYDPFGQSLSRFEIEPPCDATICEAQGPLLIAPSVDNEVDIIFHYPTEPFGRTRVNPGGVLVYNAMNRRPASHPSNAYVSSTDASESK